MLERDEERIDRALTMYLRGHRAGEIAVELGVSVSTVRRWTHDALATLADEARASHAIALEQAIAFQRAIASAAWEAYERERALDEALLRGDLDRIRRRAVRKPRRRPSTAPNNAVGDAAQETPVHPDCTPLADEAEEEYERPKRSTQGPSYLRLALAAQREVARLQGLYTRLEVSAPDVRITVTKREPGPENQPPAAPTPTTDGTDR